MVTTLHGDVFPSGHIGSTSCHCQKDLWTGSRNGHAVHHLGAKKTVEMCAVVDSGAQNNVYTTIGRNPPCTAINPCRNWYLHKLPFVFLQKGYVSLWFPLFNIQDRLIFVQRLPYKINRNCMRYEFLICRCYHCSVLEYDAM